MFMSKKLYKLMNLYSTIVYTLSIAKYREVADERPRDQNTCIELLKPIASPPPRLTKF